MEGKARLCQGAEMSVDRRSGTFRLDGRDIPYQLERRRGRRSVSLYLRPREGLLVRTPRRFPLRDIEALLREEENWIRKGLREREAWLQENPPMKFESGETLRLLGVDWSLRVERESSRKRAQVRAAGGTLVLRLPEQAEAGDVLRAWLRRLARKVLLERTRHWAEITGLHPKRITQRDNRSRWGSCSSEGSVNFNWKLVMAPPEVLDYVVVHELCHLEEPNHSSAFWNLVESVLPAYRKQRRWLREHGDRLEL